MRALVLAAVAMFVVSFVLGSPATVRAQGAADLLPSEADLKAAVAPLTLARMQKGPGIDGWDVSETFDVVGTPDGSVLVSIDAAELPTPEGAAGFLQTKLQQLRSGAASQGMVGDLKPADATLTQDADEAYLAVYMSPDGAPNRGLTAFLIARYDTQVTSVQTLMAWEGPGAVPASAQNSVGVILGVIASHVNGLASE